MVFITSQESVINDQELKLNFYLMATKKIWTAEYRRTGLAAYAESGRRDLLVILAQIEQAMRQPGAVFYRLEVESAFAGFVIQSGPQILLSYVRPHMQAITTIN